MVVAQVFKTTETLLTFPCQIFSFHPLRSLFCGVGKCLLSIHHGTNMEMCVHSKWRANSRSSAFWRFMNVLCDAKREKEKTRLMKKAFISACCTIRVPNLPKVRYFLRRKHYHILTYIRKHTGRNGQIGHNYQLWK